VDPAKSKFLDEKLKKRNSSGAKYKELLSDKERNKELEKVQMKQEKDNLINFM
jgi:hypothetical protein